MKLRRDLFILLIASSLLLACSPQKKGSESESIFDGSSLTSDTESEPISEIESKYSVESFESEEESPISIESEDESIEESIEESKEDSKIPSEVESIEESEESETSTSYEKDEDGFYILEEDYFSYEDDPSDTKERNEVYIPPLASDYPQYSQLKMFIGDHQVPIYNVKTNMSNTWSPSASSRMNNSVATFFLKGKVTVKLQASFNFLNNVTIRPLNRNVPFSIDANRRVLSFEISDYGQYAIEMRSGRCLHLFVESISRIPLETPVTYYFEPGVHNHANDSRINGNNVINLSSNQTVRFAPGAIVQAKFIANNASNITIDGCGYIDGSVFERDASNGSVLVPIEFNNCSNITLKDFACIDPAGWCFNMYFCNGVNINNVKVISSRSNGDGISIQSCQNVNVTNSFVRSWDDSLVVKNYPQWSNRNIEGTTRSVHFSNCLLWTDLAQSMEIGYETVGEVMDDITFEDIVVLHNFHKAVFSIHNGNNANITNVQFKNITVEDARMGRGDGTKHLIDFRNLFSSNWSTQHKTTTLGQVDGVQIKNVKVLDGIKDPLVVIEGCKEARDGFEKTSHFIKNVNIEDFLLYGEDLTAAYEYYSTNEYASDITFTRSDEDITGANYYPLDVSEYGNNITFLPLTSN
ncbi:MAG: hypothetical protein IJQ67_01060 [Bacilli bacterium]|nr:hypothetical protein [Bacilli bacterium]